MNDAVAIGVGAGFLGLVGLVAVAATASAAQAPVPAGVPSPVNDRANPTVTRPPTREASPGAAQPGRVSMAEARRVSWAILSVFESGNPDGQYSAFAVLRDGAGISYGRKQGTDESGTLDAIVSGYIQANGRYASQLRPYLPRLQANETVVLDPDPTTWPGWMHNLKQLLVAAGEDPVMHTVQNRVFDRLFWRPAVQAWQELGLRSPLALAVVFDTSIHSGSPAAIGWVRRRFAVKPPREGGDEREWVRQYVLARRRWLATHEKTALHATVYRMDAFLRLIDAGNWGLHTPIHITRPRATIR